VIAELDSELCVFVVCIGLDVVDRLYHTVVVVLVVDLLLGVLVIVADTLRRCNQFAVTVPVVP